MDEYTAYYPSGRKLTIVGVWKGFVKFPENQGGGPAFKSPTGEIILPDPRAVIFHSSGVKIYSPRLFKNQMLKVMRDWLDDNRDWPKRLKEAY